MHLQKEKVALANAKKSLEQEILQKEQQLKDLEVHMTHVVTLSAFLVQGQSAHILYHITRTDTSAYLQCLYICCCIVYQQDKEGSISRISSIGLVFQKSEKTKVSSVGVQGKLYYMCVHVP